MTSPEEAAFRERVGRIETLIATIENFPDPAVRDTTVELVQAIMELHSAGIERMLDIAWEKGDAGREIIDSFAADELLANLLLLHGLHPLDIETRVTQALDKVRPYLKSHGGNVELLAVDEGVVHLRLQGSCNGCASSAMTLKLAIEEAIHELAPDIAGMEVEGVVPPPPMPASAFIPLTQVGGVSRPPSSPGKWETLGDLSTLSDGHTRTLEVAGKPVLLSRLAGTLYAYDNTCPSCQHSLDQAQLKATSLTCPHCGNTYDIMRAGRCLDQPNLHLEPFPLLEQQGRVKVALPSQGSGVRDQGSVVVSTP